MDPLLLAWCAVAALGLAAGARAYPRATRLTVLAIVAAAGIVTVVLVGPAMWAWGERAWGALGW